MVLSLALPMLLRKVQLQPFPPTRKGKYKIQIGVENELHDNSDFEFEKLLNFDKSLYEGEEKVAYTY